MSEEILDRAEVEDELTHLTIAEARKQAKLYNVPLSRDMTSDDIKAAIRRKITKHNMARVADTSTGPAPGYYRIIVHKNNEQGKVGQRPVYVHVQGFKVNLPRNVPVDVPEKIVRALENSTHWVTVETDNGTSAFEPQLSYPFQIIGHTPGPDPKPGYEKTKARRYGIRKAFWQHYGYWPKNQAMINEAIKDGTIKAPSLPAFNSDN